MTGDYKRKRKYETGGQAITIISCLLFYFLTKVYSVT